MPSTWRAIGMTEFLEARVDEFKASQKARQGMKKFFKRTYTCFFDQWQEQDDEEFEEPKPLLTKKGKVSQRAQQPQPRKIKKFESMEDWRKDREKKIRNWFYNHTIASRKGRSRINLKVGLGKAGKQRVLSEENLYSKKYYVSRVKPIVDEELTEIDDNVMRIAITRRILRETWLKEDAPTKKEIKDLRKGLVKAAREEEEEIQRLLNANYIPGSLDPEELLLMQQAMPDIMHNFLKMIASLTGWSASMVVGGPDMRKVNGELSVRSYHVGAGFDGTTWKEHVPEIDERWAKPFREFLRVAYPETERLRWAVEIDSKFVKNPQALVDAHRGDGRLVFIDSPDTPEEMEARLQREAAEVAKANETDTTGGKALQKQPESGTSLVDDAIKAQPEVGTSSGNEVANKVDEPHEGIGGKQGDEDEDEEGESEGDEEQTMPDIIWTKENGHSIPLLNDNGDVENMYRSLPLDTGAGVAYNPDFGTVNGFPAETFDLEDPATLPFEDTKLDTVTSGAQANRSMFDGGYSGDYILPDFTGNPAPDEMAFSQATASAATNGGMPDEGYGMFPRYNNEVERGVWGGSFGGLGFNDGTFNQGSGGGMFDQGFGGGMFSNAGTGGLAPNMGTTWTSGYDNGILWSGAVSSGDLATREGPAGYGRMTGGGLNAMGAPSAVGGTGTSAGFEMRMGGGLNVARGGTGGTRVGGQMVAEGGRDTGSAGVESKGTGPSTSSTTISKGASESKHANGGSAKGVVSEGIGEKRKRPEKEKLTNLEQPASPIPPKEKRARAAREVDLPEWIDQAKIHMTQGISNETWTRLVDCWYDFESRWAKKGMAQSGRVSVTNRPEAMRAWLTVPRDYDTVPDIGDVQKFAGDWTRWWNGMQPKERRGEDGAMPKALAKKMNMGTLKKGGHLGIAVVLIALRWWGGHDEVEGRWEEAVEDLLSVMRRFLDT